MKVGDQRARPKVRHLTSAHEIDDSRILQRECKSLAAAGYDVGIVAGQPPSPDIEGVRIVGTGAPRNRFDRAFRVAWRVYRAARRERADVYHFHDPELLWVGLLLKLERRRVVYDVHEDLPKQIMDKFWVPRPIRRPLAAVATVAEKLGGRVFDAVAAATPSIAARFPAAKTVVVQNFPSAALARADVPDVPFDERPYAFAYTGGLTEVQGLREMADAALLLDPELPGVLAGWFDSDDLEKEVRASAGWQRLEFLGELAPAEVVPVLRQSRTGLVVDRPIGNYLESYSTKMFEYMACGIPVIFSDFPMWMQLVGDADCGTPVDPHDPSAIAAAVKRLATDPDEARRLGENGRRAVRERYNWEVEFTKLDALYRRLA